MCRHKFLITRPFTPVFKRNDSNAQRLCEESGSEQRSSLLSHEADGKECVHPMRGGALGGRGGEAGHIPRGACLRQGHTTDSWAILKEFCPFLIAVSMRSSLAFAILSRKFFLDCCIASLVILSISFLIKNTLVNAF